MISIVTAYYNRRALLVRTLDSIQRYAGELNFEMIVVDDGSKNEERLEDLEAIYSFLRVHRINPEDKWYFNPCIPFNIGFGLAKGDKIILQNPECYHFDDILKYVEKQLKPNMYLSFGCFSLDKENTDNDDFFFDRDNIKNLISKSAHVVKVDGGLGWYNHSKFRPNSYHFCTAIMAEDLVDLGGFDPRYALGHGSDDDELIYRIRMKRMNIRYVDNHIVLHQNHYVKPITVNEQKTKYINPRAERNQFIYKSITCRNNGYKVDYLSINRFKPNYKPTLGDWLRKLKIKLIGH